VEGELTELRKKDPRPYKGVLYKLMSDIDESHVGTMITPDDPAVRLASKELHNFKSMAQYIKKWNESTEEYKIKSSPDYIFQNMENTKKEVVDIALKSVDYVQFKYKRSIKWTDLLPFFGYLRK